MKYEEYKKLTQEQKEEYDWRFKDNSSVNLEPLTWLFLSMMFIIYLSLFKSEIDNELLGSIKRLLTLMIFAAIFFTNLDVCEYLLGSLKERMWKKKIKVK